MDESVGSGAGAGIVTGLRAGAFLILDAAREQGLIATEQDADILRAAARQVASEDLPDGPDTSEIDCAVVVAELRSAAD
ncbi:hypothetical protein [Rubrimonas cliftonensis]|uniref:Uncharacterized protein n=1 Tax=Rubrimonas cliftonensis TaxID=89524 RepID=A0A1H4FPU8_9RHOB|nr:hypothetical protein [Rubrimonas cliftonensis]SEA99107.1 hypothetical protein SAMN05444370_12614 [Rubrimonas cliftonensis]